MSAVLDDPEIARLVEKTNFSTEEIAALYKRFAQMRSQSNSDHGIRQEEFQQAFGLGKFEAYRLFRLFSRSNSDLTFEQLCCGLSAFSPNASTEEKMRASFDFFDANSDGKIDREEIKKAFEQFLEENDMYVGPEHVDAIVAQTLSSFGVETSGHIDFEMYKAMVEHHPQLIAAMTISTWQLPL
eukprot:c12425_g1_i1.p1 GENE.c12425_g1_i1~~c12425_g1_i1.p1  ORF type:complete len:196 (-),score=52.11 c12425_g1_i1:24-575(-)